MCACGFPKEESIQGLGWPGIVEDEGGPIFHLAALVRSLTGIQITGIDFVQAQ